MLNAIRVAAANWLGRAVLTVIMGLLIISFAIWGIGDIFKGGIDRTIATVGSAKISADDYRSALNNELRRIQMQVRRAVTMEEARAFGLDRDLLNRKIDEAALAQEAGKLGLALDPGLVLGSIMDAPEFKTAGQFDRAKLSEALGQAGMNEKEFVRVQEQHLMRLELFNGLVGGLNAPQALLEAVHAFRFGKRDVDVLTLDAAKVPAPPAADAAAMTAYYEAHKGEFRTVETRKATVLSLSVADFAGGIKPSAEEVKAYFKAAVEAGKIGTPERRQIQRVLFDTEAEAKAAAEKITAGTTFEALLAERKLAEGDVDFGIRVKGEIADAAQREALFSAPEGKVAGPFKDAFGFVLYRVSKVHAARIPAPEDMREQLEADARADKIARDTGVHKAFEAAVKAIEDARLAGKGLADAAKAANVAVRAVAALDKDGNDGAGHPVGLPGGAPLVAAIFASDIGLDNEPITEKDGTHLWYEVNAVEPARDRPFEDVKAEVVKRLDAQARDKALLDQANGIIKRVAGGETLDKVAGELGLKVVAVKGIRRGQRDAALGGSGVDRAFSGPVRQAVTAPAPDGIHRLVIVPTSDSVPAFDPAALETSGVTKQVAQGIADDIMAEYVAGVRQRIGVNVNQALLAKTVGQAN